jgi:hypothetical protein
MRIGRNQRAPIPADRVDNKITRQADLLMEAPEEQRGGRRRITRPAWQMPRSDPSRLVWEAAAANERLGPLTGLWFESAAARSTR